MFSATLTPSKIINLKSIILKAPEIIELNYSNHKTNMPTQLQQYYVPINYEEKFNYLYSFISTHLKSKIIVFFSTVKAVRFFYETIRKIGLGMRIFELTSKKSQSTRAEITTTFKNKETTSSLLLCTDVASRGLDFEFVDWVIQ